MYNRSWGCYYLTSVYLEFHRNSNYFDLRDILGYFALCQAISIYLGLWRSILVHLEVSQAIFSFLMLPRAISGCLWLYLAIFASLRLYLLILGYLWLSLAIFAYLWLYQTIFGYLNYLWKSPAISGYIGLCLPISDDPYQVSSIRLQVETRVSKLLQFETFFSPFFSHLRFLDELALLKMLT